MGLDESDFRSSPTLFSKMGIPSAIQLGVCVISGVIARLHKDMRGGVARFLRSTKKQGNEPADRLPSHLKNLTISYYGLLFYPAFPVVILIFFYTFSFATLQPLDIIQMGSDSYQVTGIAEGHSIIASPATATDISSAPATDTTTTSSDSKVFGTYTSGEAKAHSSDGVAVADARDGGHAIAFEGEPGKIEKAMQKIRE